MRVKDLIVSGTMICQGGIAIPPEAVDNDAVAPEAALAASKMEHQHPVRHYIAAPAVTLGTPRLYYIHVAAGAGEIVAAYAVLGTLPSGSDTVTVRIYKGDPASLVEVTDDPVAWTSASTERMQTVSLGADLTLAAGDVIVVSVDKALAGAAAHLAVVVVVREDPVT